MKIDLPIKFVMRSVVNALIAAGKLKKNENIHCEFVIKSSRLAGIPDEVTAMRIRSGTDHPDAKKILNPYS